MANDLKTKLVIEAQTQGQESIARLTDELEALAREGGDAGPKFQLLAAELRALGQQQQLVDQFAKLKQHSQAYAQAAQQAQQATKAAALELKAKAAALGQAQEAEHALTTQLQQARQSHADIGQAIALARQELKQLGQASRQAGGDTQLLRERMGDVRNQLKALQTSYRDAGAQAKTLATEQRAAAAASAALSREAASAQAGFDRQRGAAAEASRIYKEARTQLQGLRDAMGAAGISSSKLAAEQARIRQETAQTTARAAQLREQYRALGQAARASGEEQVRSHRRIGEGVQSISRELAILRNTYIGLQGALGFARSVQGLAQTADAVSGLQSRIKLATGEGELFARMWQRVADVAQQTGANLEATGELFASLTTAGRDAGLGAAEAAEQSLQLVQTINHAVQVSGASAQASDAAVRQLIQALQSGVLRGDEFNSVMEQAPRLARALADGLGVTVGQLRGLAEQGELTSKAVISALQSQAQTLEQEFGRMPQTVGRALENLATSWSLMVDKINQGTGGTNLLISAIDALANNLETVAAWAVRAGAAGAGKTCTSQKTTAASSPTWSWRFTTNSTAAITTP